MIRKATILPFRHSRGRGNPAVFKVSGSPMKALGDDELDNY